MKIPIAAKAAVLLIVHVLVWGLVGYLIGGWETARNFGLIAGPILALCNFIPVIIRARRGHTNSSQ
jgi:hypothetical protein